ncbi:MAG: autotransporter domain-containing protein [Gammaproteobacteria bacterium]|nr:autotransporter domain-containing protein [Gammaproteobacteria bacterium]
MHFIYKLMLSIMIFGVATTAAMADVTNVRVSIEKNKSIVLNLTNSITNIAIPQVTIPTPPANGSATAITCTTDTGTDAVRCISYTPNPDFVGLDTLGYTVLNNAGSPESATITINVGSATPNTQGTTPSIAIEATLNDICLRNSEEALTDLCLAFSAATQPGREEDLRELLDALSPQSIAAQGTLNNELIKEQLSNISKRLTALRRGQSKTLLSGLTLQLNGESIAGNMLDTLFPANSSGGSAGSVNGFNNRWDWYISGKIGGGEQTETDFEDGFKFDANNISTGMDIRLNNQAIIGAALGFGTATMDINHNGGGLEIDGFSMTLYGSYYPTSNTYIDAILNLGANNFEMDRRIVFGLTDVTARSDTESASVALSVAGGYDYVIGGLSASFSGRLDYIDTAIDGYAESDGSGFGVTIKGQNVSQLVSSIGTQLNYAMSLPWGVLLPHLGFSWLHQFDNDAIKVEGYFLADSNQTLFSFDANIPDSDYFVAALGTSAVFSGGKSAFVQYETPLGQNHLEIWNISGGLRLEF